MEILTCQRHHISSISLFLVFLMDRDNCAKYLCDCILCPNCHMPSVGKHPCLPGGVLCSPYCNFKISSRLLWMDPGLPKDEKEVLILSLPVSFPRRLKGFYIQEWFDWYES